MGRDLACCPGPGGDIPGNKDQEAAILKLGTQSLSNRFGIGVLIGKSGRPNVVPGKIFPCSWLDHGSFLDEPCDSPRSQLGSEGL